MYKSVYVPVDNSNYSNQAINIGVEIGKKFQSKITGNHVYAAKMHDYRFKQMEYTLPDEYLQEQELEKQRKIHDSLIGMGLKLISDCYLDGIDKKCQEAGLEFEREMVDGKHYVEILKSMQKNEPDLTVLGALGIGKMKDSQIGAVAERVSRYADRDVWIVKHIPKDEEEQRDTILVGIDGSPQSFGALMTAAELAKKFDKKIKLISVYDPYLHYMVFNSIVDVLNDKAAKVFRFEEQNQLHEEVIDTGLADIYQSHLNVAEGMITKEEVECAEKVLLDGKTFQKILDETRKNPPWLLVLGRIGVHSEKEEKGLGSNTDNLVRLAPCDILLSTRLEYPELDKKAEESILWTPEAEERMKMVPELVKGIARTGILRLAVEQGHSVITNTVIDEAMDRFMPKYAAKATEKLGEALAFKKARQGKSAMCIKCGVTATEENPKECFVCGGDKFQEITPEMIDQIVAQEGGGLEEETYDGRKIVWTMDAREILKLIKDPYQRRRAKALLEKSARHRKLNTITGVLAKEVLETGLSIPFDQQSKEALDTAFNPSKVDTKSNDLSESEVKRGIKIIALDKKGNPLKSVFSWSNEAQERILRVPNGFMRDRVQASVEGLALDRQLISVDLELVEEGVALGRKQMEEMLMSAEAGKPIDMGQTDPRVNNLNEYGIMQKMDQERTQLQN